MEKAEDDITNIIFQNHMRLIHSGGDNEYYDGKEYVEGGGAGGDFSEPWLMFRTIAPILPRRRIAAAV